MFLGNEKTRLEAGVILIPHERIRAVAGLSGFTLHLPTFHPWRDFVVVFYSWVETYATDIGPLTGLCGFVFFCRNWIPDGFWCYAYLFSTDIKPLTGLGGFSNPFRDCIRVTEGISFDKNPFRDDINYKGSLKIYLSS